MRGIFVESQNQPFVDPVGKEEKQKAADVKDRHTRGVHQSDKNSSKDL